MIGETISHYRIIERIGVGGMGEVYRAEDPRLEREVAIKTLPAAFSDHPDRLLRFEREARAAGSLNHPNVLAIYDVGTHEGTPYIVSELLHGETLRDVMDAASLTRRKAVEYAVQIAEGLAAAHAKRFVHRDLKPDNVFVTREGHVKILDFGLAKLIYQTPAEGETAEMPTADMVTEEGSVIGTAAYMSPEQLRGLKVDHRSDIFSFGVMLYEMLSGRRPFGGDSKAQVVASILRDDPPDLGDSIHPAPASLERIVRQCLEKRPEDRFESARDLAFTLRALADSGVSASSPTEVQRRPGRRWRSAAVGAAMLTLLGLAGWGLVSWLGEPPLPERMSIAVLPIGSAGDDPAEHLMAEGIRENLLDGLFLLEAQTRGRVRVAPRSSSDTLERAWRREVVSMGVGGVFGVTEGRVRFSLDLRAADGGRRLRHAAIADEMSNLSCLQREPILKIFEMLGEEIEPATLAGLDSLASIVQQACVGCLRGRGLVSDSADPESLAEGIDALEQALTDDPGYGFARIAMARACLLEYQQTGDRSWIDQMADQIDRLTRLDGLELLGSVEGGRLFLGAGLASRAIEPWTRATEIADWSADAFVGLGAAYEAVDRFEEAEQAYQSAIARRPDHWAGHEALGFLYWSANRYDAAVNQFRRVTELAPNDPDVFNNYGGVLASLGRRDQAIEAFQHSLRIKPNPVAHSQLGTVHFLESRFGSAAEEQEKALAMSPDDFELLANLAASHHWGGQREKAAEVYARAIEVGERRLESGDRDPVLLARLASCHAMIGHRDRARELLRGFTDRPPSQARVMGFVAEAYEDLGERESALSWIDRALQNGLRVDWIEERPSLSRLGQDPRYQQLIGSAEEP